MCELLKVYTPLQLKMTVIPVLKCPELPVLVNELSVLLIRPMLPKMWAPPSSPPATIVLRNTLDVLCDRRSRKHTMELVLRVTLRRSFTRRTFGSPV